MNAGRRPELAAIPVVTETDDDRVQRRALPYSEVDMERWSVAGLEVGRRRVPEEVPVAVRVNCTDYAVMLASPTDLEDFTFGFLFTEGVIGGTEDIRALDLVEREEGIVARVELSPKAAWRPGGRRLAGATGCGLCGVETLRDAVRPVRRVERAEGIGAGVVCRAVSTLRDWQPLNASTGALHAAAFATAAGQIVVAREDVGRHNALDKLIGAMVRAGKPPDAGFVVMTSRCSFELVQKAARFGIRLLCTVSAPTALAIRLAEDAGMTLISLARPDSLVVLAGGEHLE